MAQRAIVIGIAAVSLGGSSARAQTVPRITLEQAVALHAANSLDLRLARADATERVGSARAAGAFPNPQLGISHESLSDATRDAGETYLTLSQELVWPWVVSARGTAVSRARTAAGARVAVDSLRLVFELKLAYVEAWLAERRYDVAREVVEVFRQADASAGERFAAGDVSGYDRRRIRLERARYEHLLARSQVALGAARRTLATLVMPDSSITSVAPTPPPLPAPGAVHLDAEMVDQAAAAHPLVRSAEAAFAAARARRRAVAGARVPTPTLTAGYKTQRDGLDGIFIGASLPLPLFNHGGGALQQAEAAASAGDARVALARRVVQNDARRAADRLRLATAALESVATDGLEGVDQLLTTAQVSYAEGEVELLGLLDAASTFATLGVTASELTAEFWTSVFDVERAIGAPLGVAWGGETDR